MKTKEITVKTPINKILKAFSETKNNESINLKLPNGNFIYLAGGILSMLKDNKHYIAKKGKWVEMI